MNFQFLTARILAIPEIWYLSAVLTIQLLLGWVDTHHGVSTEEAEEKPEVQAPVEEDDDDEICDMEDFEDDDDLVIRKFVWWPYCLDFLPYFLQKRINLI